MNTYHVEVVRDGRWWAIDVPDLPGVFSQARHLREVEAMARDAIALMLEVPEDSFDLDINIQLPAEVRRHIEHAAELREQAARAQHQAAEESRAAARELAAAGLPLRDVGQALGVSYQRAHQLVS